MDLTTLLSAFAVIGSLIAAWFFTSRHNPESVPESRFTPPSLIPDETIAVPTVERRETTVPDTVPQDASAAEKLYRTAHACLGKDLTPGDSIPDEVACVVQLQEIVFRALGFFIGEDEARYNTYHLLLALMRDLRFQMVIDPRPGDIAVCATGSSSPYTPAVPRGHCAIVGKTHWMSNSSYTDPSKGLVKGLWQANYTKKSWLDYFGTKGGYPTYYFRAVDIAA